MTTNIDQIFEDFIEKQNRREWKKHSSKKYPIDEFERDYFASVLSKADMICKKNEFNQKKSNGEMSEEEISFMEKIPYWLID